jgi:hypothetical protein
MKLNELEPTMLALYQRMASDNYSDTVIGNTKWILNHFRKYCISNRIEVITVPVMVKFLHEKYDMIRPLRWSLLVLLLLRLVFTRLFIYLMVRLAFGRLGIRLHVRLAIRLEFGCLEILFAIRLIFGCADICPYTRFKRRRLAIRFPVRPLMRLVLRRLAMRSVIRLHPRFIFTCFPSRLMLRRVIAQRIFRLVVRLAALFRTSLYMPARLKRPFTYYTNHVIRICFHFYDSCGQKINSYYFLEIISPRPGFQISFYS